MSGQEMRFWNGHEKSGLTCRNVCFAKVRNGELDLDTKELEPHPTPTNEDTLLRLSYDTTQRSMRAWIPTLCFSLSFLETAPDMAMSVDHDGSHD